MGITVFITVAQLFHQLGRRIAQVQRHFQGAVLGGRAQGGLEAHIHRIAFWRAGQVGDGLGHRQFAFRAAEALLHIPGRQAQAQSPRVGVADVFAGHAYHAAGQVQGVAATVDHAREPIQRTVRVGAAYGFVQRRNLVVKRFAALVETPACVTEQALQQVDTDFAAVFGQVRGVFQQIEKAAAVAVCGREQNLEGFVANAQPTLAQPLVFAQGAMQ